jgi:hypothetical protein
MTDIEERFAGNGDDRLLVNFVRFVVGPSSTSSEPPPTLVLVSDDILRHVFRLLF